MARYFTILASMAAFASVVADQRCDTSGEEESCLLQSSSLQGAEVKGHQNTQRCTHLTEAIQKQAAKNKAGCMGGRMNGEPYCAPGKEVACPGSPGVTCGMDIEKPCCPNPCIGVEPYGNKNTFPCPSNPSDSPKDECDSNDKVEDCLDPCAPTPPPTPTVPPTPPTPTWRCQYSDLTPPGFKATANMACNTNSTCYGDYVSDCETGATCYAKIAIETCSTGAHCCAGQNITTCATGSTCYAVVIDHCKTGASCFERPKWADYD